ncbi:alpha/beta hydrolase [Oceanithermus sp.]
MSDAGLLTGAVLAAGYVGSSLQLVLRSSRPQREVSGLSPAVYGLDYGPVKVKSRDGLELAAWWVPGGRERKAALLVHGLNASKASPYVLPALPVYAGLGYSVLLLDLRAHGNSPGTRTTLGITETRDVLGGLDWLAQHGFPQQAVVLHGWSMGAATVLQVAAEEQVRAVVADSGYARLSYLLRQRVGGLLYPGVSLAARLVLKADPGRAAPEEAAARLRAAGVPLFLLHGQADRTVPFDNAIRIRKRYPESTFWALPGFPHVSAWRHPQYGARLRSFLESLGGRW